MTQETRVLIKTSRATVLQLESVEKAKAFILKQREKFLDKCPAYKLIEQTIQITEREIAV